MENTGLQLASPATPAKDVPLTQYEAETAAILEQKAIRQSLLDAALERELVVITDTWSETVFNETLARTVPFSLALLRDLFETIRYESDDKRKFRVELDSGLLRMLTRVRQKPLVSAEFAKATSLKFILG